MSAAQDTPLGATRDEMVHYLAAHDEQCGARADQLSVHVDYHDLCDWRDALDAAEARQAVLARYGRALAQRKIPPGVKVDEWNAAQDELEALALALAASPAPGVVAGEEGQ